MDQNVQFALNIGFSDAALIRTTEIPFEPSFRKYCADNLCGNYGVNWSCPPDCGTTDEMENQIKQYPWALVVHTAWEIDYHDHAEVKRTKEAHNQLTRELIAQMPKTKGFFIAASGCSLCEICSKVKGEPCRFPDKMASCMSAYCIHVRKLTEICEMEYDSGPDVVNFFGMYVYEEC